jgi:hypothetical protein
VRFQLGWEWPGLFGWELARLIEIAGRILLAGSGPDAALRPARYPRAAAALNARSGKSFGRLIRDNAPPHAAALPNQKNPLWQHVRTDAPGPRSSMIQLANVILIDDIAHIYGDSRATCAKWTRLS